MSTVPPIEPAPAGLPRANRGCWKGALYGCGGGAVLIVACLVLIGIYVRRNPGTITDMLMNQVRDRYASDVTAQDKADLEAAYKDFRAALEDKKIRREDIERVRTTVSLGREVRRSDVLELTRVFREATANAEAGAAGATPVPTLAPLETTPSP